MQSKLKKFGLCILFWGVSFSDVYAGLALQTLYGAGKGDLSVLNSAGDLERSLFSTTKVTVETHLDPIKSLPFTIGLFYSKFQGKPEVPDNELQSIDGFDYGWDVLTWTNVKSFGVSLRYGQALGGQYKFNDLVSTGEANYRTFQVNYSFIGLGLATPVSNSFGVLLEYRQRIQSKFKRVGGKVGSEDSIEGFDGGMLLVGLEVSV